MDSNSTTGNVSQFVTNRYVKSAWIALFTLWILWGLSYLIRHAFGPDNRARTTHENGSDVVDNPGNAAPHTSTAAPVTNHHGTNTAANEKAVGNWRGGPHNTLLDRFTRAHQILFENTMLLLPVLVLNTFGAGSTRAVHILAWIFFAFTVIYALTELAVHHHFIRLIFNLIFFGIALAIGALAFKHGWNTF